MSTSKVFARLAATSAVAVVLVTVAVATPAYAEDAVEVNISGLASTMSAGSRPDGFTVKLQNQTEAEIQPIGRAIVIQLPGLTPDGVRITRGVAALPVEGGSGEVRAADQLLVGLGPNRKARDSVTTPYTIQFLAGAPGGKAEVTAQAYRGQTLLGSDREDITVRGGAAPTTTASPGATGVVPTFETPPAQSIAPIQADQPLLSDDFSGIPVAFYVVGALLVGVGGVLLWLLFRPRPALVDAGYPAGDHRATPPSLGYPSPRHAAPSSAPTANLHPTAVLPAVGDQKAPPPAVDPWGTQAGQPGRTQEFRPPQP